MPPRVNNRNLSIIVEEDYNCDLSLMATANANGSIEIVDENSSGILKIVYVPPEEEQPQPRSYDQSSNSFMKCMESELAEEEKDGVEFSIYDYFQNACSSCATAGTQQRQTQLSSSFRNKAKQRAAATCPTGMIPSRVSFSQLEINEFAMTLGHHPASVRGPPVMLDYNEPAGGDYQQRVVTVDDYENSRQPRRQRRDLKLTYQERKGLLTTRFSEREVHDAWAEALLIRKQRQETLNRGLILMFVDDLTESASRKYRRLTESLYSNMNGL
jgi:hypothetical protein